MDGNAAALAAPFPAFPPPGFPQAPPEIPEHPEFSWRVRNRGTPITRDADFRRSIQPIVVKKSQRHPVTGHLPESVHQARVVSEMKQSCG